MLHLLYLHGSFATLMSSTLLIILVTSVLLSYRRKTNRFHRLIDKLPRGPWSLPIVGNALQLLGGLDRILQYQLQWAREYGGIYCTRIGLLSNVNISSPELMESILNSQKILDKGVDYNFLVPWLGDGLLLSRGAKWKSRRRLLTPAFHFKILDSFVDISQKQGRILCQLLGERCSRPNQQEPAAAGLSPTDGEIDVYPFITNCTLDIICEAAMRTEMHAQTRQSSYVKAVNRMTQIVGERWSEPWFTWDLLFNLTPKGREHNRLLRTLHSFTDQVILNRKEDQHQPLNQHSEDRGDNAHTDGLMHNQKSLIDLLLENLDASGLSSEDLRDEINTFMFEGHDTTASSITWFLYCMATNAHIQEKVLDELHLVFGSCIDRLITPEDVINLHYLECCIKESLRLYPTVPFIERFAREDIQVGKYLIPAGANIILLIRAMHHDPNLFEKPLEFIPERFTTDQSIGRHPYAFIPFSAGPRNCIGQRFAMQELKVVLSLLLHHFKFSVPTHHHMKAPIPSFQLVLKPLNSRMQLIVTPRVTASINDEQVDLH